MPTLGAGILPLRPGRGSPTWLDQGTGSAEFPGLCSQAGSQEGSRGKNQVGGLAQAVTFPSLPPPSSKEAPGLTLQLGKLRLKENSLVRVSGNDKLMNISGAGTVTVTYY